MAADGYPVVTVRHISSGNVRVEAPDGRTQSVTPGRFLTIEGTRQGLPWKARLDLWDGRLYVFEAGSSPQEIQPGEYYVVFADQPAAGIFPPGYFEPEPAVPTIVIAGEIYAGTASD